MVTKHFERDDLAEAVRLDQDAVRFHPEEIVASLDGSGVDHIGALAVSGIAARRVLGCSPTRGQGEMHKSEKRFSQICFHDGVYI